MVASALNKPHEVSPPDGAADTVRSSQAGTGPALNKPHEVSSALTIPLSEVAAALGLSPASLMRKHKRLSSNHGFPPPLPGGVWMWSRSAFEAWVRANGVQDVELDATDPVATAANDRTIGLVRSQNAALRARYGVPQ